jgi:hypothetical protein
MFKQVLKYNKCHNPAGAKGGQFCSGDSKGAGGSLSNPPMGKFAKTAATIFAAVMLAVNEKTFDSRSAPETIKQSAASKEEMYKKGSEALPLYEKFMGDVAKILDATVSYDLMQSLDDAEAGIKGPVVVIAPLKTEESFMRKVVKENDGKFDSVGDLVRGMVMVDTIAELPQVLDALKASGAVFARPVKNRFEKPTPSGYRDIMMNITLPNGHIAEVQVNTKEMVIAKERKGHPLYAIERELVGQIDFEKRQPTPEEAKRIKELQSAQNEVYRAAFERSLGIRKSERVKKAWLL